MERIAPDNSDRAAWAYEALRPFARKLSSYKLPSDYAGMDQETKECAKEALSDLLADLLHLADRMGLDTGHMLNSAIGCFQEEKHEEYVEALEEKGETYV